MGLKRNVFKIFKVVKTFLVIKKVIRKSKIKTAKTTDGNNLKSFQHSASASEFCLRLRPNVKKHFW